MLDRTVLIMSVCIIQTKKKRKTGASSLSDAKNMEADSIVLMQHFCLSKISTAFAKNITEPLNH